MNFPDKLKVSYHDSLVGYLCMKPGAAVCLFEYSPQWLKDGFSISPLELPLRPGLFVAEEMPFYGNFGIFADSLPDGYGMYLLHKILQKQKIDFLSLTPVQRLSLVGSRGMGALCYSPATEIANSIPEMPDFDKMQQLALEVLGEKTPGDEEILYYNSGNSGGCRPKCMFSDKDGHWLVKFRHTYDPLDMGAREYEYAVAARKCGLPVPDFKLIGGKYFASRRFDISADGTRRHIATAAALLREGISPPKVDYINLVHLTGYLTQDREQVEQMLRYMAFNVLSENKDDHAKNFSFIYDGDRWRLAPAYDLTYNPSGYNGEHATSANYAGNPTIDDMLCVARSIRVPERRFMEIVAPIREVCASLVESMRGVRE